jgi:hypothetical protein
MSFLQWIGLAPKMADDVFDSEKGHLAKMGGFINDLHLSDPERLKHNEKMAEAVQNYAIATLNENTDRSKTRRTIATNWFDMQVKLIKLTVLVVLIDHLAIELELQKGYALADKVSEITFSPMLWGITSGIGLFFWGTHALRSSKLGK